LVEKIATYVNFHPCVKAIVHDQAVGHSNTVRLHGMSGNVGIISTEVRRPQEDEWKSREHTQHPLYRIEEKAVRKGPTITNVDKSEITYNHRTAKVSQCL